jgi:hypothetical protein
MNLIIWMYKFCMNQEPFKPHDSFEGAEVICFVRMKEFYCNQIVSTMMNFTLLSIYNLFI